MPCDEAEAAPGPSSKRRKVDDKWKGEQCSIKFKQAALNSCRTAVTTANGRRLEPSEFEAAIQASYDIVTAQLTKEISDCDALMARPGHASCRWPKRG